MKIELMHVTVRDLVTGYEDRGDDGVVGYSGRLDIRPKFQREFVYSNAQRDAVIDTVSRGFPLNVMYWAVTGTNQAGETTYEIIDGQQRTISLCQYISGGILIPHLFGVEGPRGFHNLSEEEREKLLGYELMIYSCEGSDSEKLEWFRTINIAGEELTEQELRNAVYAGPWVTDAKRYFSRSGSRAESAGEGVVKRVRVRQEYLELALEWICEAEKRKSIEEYMATHQHDDSAEPLWQYYCEVVDWVNRLFPHKRKEKVNQAWGSLYLAHRATRYDATKLEAELSKLLKDEDVQSKRGIYPYVLQPCPRTEAGLSIRAFEERVKSQKYEEQQGRCAKCGQAFAQEEMEADHITPWSQGGKTVPENCQMLCRECNRRKGAH